MEKMFETKCVNGKGVLKMKNKTKILKYLLGMELLIKGSPELFHDRIDLDLIDYIKDIRKLVNEK